MIAYKNVFKKKSLNPKNDPKKTFFFCSHERNNFICLSFRSFDSLELTWTDGRTDSTVEEEFTYIYGSPSRNKTTFLCWFHAFASNPRINQISQLEMSERVDGNRVHRCECVIEVCFALSRSHSRSE